MTDLGTLGGTNSIGNGINDAGQVVGTSHIQGNSTSHAFLATPFWRQADAKANGTNIPAVFGYVKPSPVNARSSMIKSGCALCSAASAARSAIALKAKVTSIPILTPALLDSLLTAPGAHGYSSTNNFNWLALPAVLKPYANLTVKLLPVSADGLDQMLYDQISKGNRVVLKFKETKKDLNTGLTLTSPSDPPLHFVWVIGKDGTDWKLGDGGWTKNISPPEAIESLNGHLAGFQVTNGAGHQILHTFQPVSLIIFSNSDYTPPASPAPSGQSAVLAASEAAAAPSSPPDIAGASVVMTASGPVALVLTDPNGSRVGHDQNTATDFNEIADASYYTDEPILSADDDDAAAETEGGTSTNVIVPSPVPGIYTLAVTGTDAGSSEVILRAVGPGGASRIVQTTISTLAGQTTTRQIEFPQPETTDLAVSQRVAADQVSLGGSLVCTITVSNNGMVTASAPQFTAVFSEGVGLVSAVSSSGTCTLSGSLVGCELDDMAPGASATVTITITPTLLGAMSSLASIKGFDSDSDETNNSASALINVSGTSLENWRQQFFGIAMNSGNAGDTYDYDRDGLPNLIEWACNLNPAVADTLPAGAVRNGANVEFTYTRSVDALNAGASFVVEWSDTLANDWQSTGVSETVLSDDGIVQQVKATLPAGSSGRRFAHLKVTAPP